MKNKPHLVAVLTLISSCNKTIAAPEHPEILVSTESILKATEEPFYDGRIPIDIDGDRTNDSTINYSYSKIGPSGTCSNEPDCTPETRPIITFYIETKNKNIPINFMCESIGIYHKKTNNNRDLFCGPNTKLHWDGHDYTD